MNVRSCSRTRRQNFPSSARVLASAGSTTLSECTVTQFFKKMKAGKIFDEVGEMSLERFFPGFTEDTQRQPVRYWVQQSTRCCPPSTPGSSHCTRIVDMIRDATAAGLLPEQPLLARLSALIESATAAVVGALGDAGRPTARLYLQKTAKAADESWQQTTQGYKRPNRHERKSARN